MITQKLHGRDKAKAIRLFACKGQKKAYCDETNTNRQTLYRMLNGNAVESKHIETLLKHLKTKS